MIENQPEKEGCSSELVRFEALLQALPEQHPLDDDIAIRLAHARALAVLEAKPTTALPWAAAALIMVAVAIAFQWQHLGTSSPATTPWQQDLDLATAAEDLELLEDLEFYQWLSDVEAG